ncbi:MAG: class I SAM-dependent methyltransferase [Anaerolineae bacterium]|nr:class I SAM-dependent methyltransferase [Anaerolineae bacterium]
MNSKQSHTPVGWDPVADWYDGWVGPHGSHHHRKLAIPAVMSLLEPRPEVQILDVGCGQGVLAPHIADSGAVYTGVDISPKMIAAARRHHPSRGRFLRGDARHLNRVSALRPHHFDAAVFLLSIEDINPLEEVIASAAWALRPAGALVILMRHPCFRVPRQSGWGHDEGRKLRYRRVDSYLTPLSVPMKAYEHSRSGTTISFHRPLNQYVNALAAHGFAVDYLDELVTYEQGQNRAERRANEEFPLFLVLRARSIDPKG